MQRFCKKHNIIQIFTKPYSFIKHIDKKNHIVKKTLKRLMLTYKSKKWVYMVQRVCIGYNGSAHSITK